MSESAPRDNTDAPSGCGDQHCSDGQLDFYDKYGRDKTGRLNASVKTRNKTIRNGCLLCAIAVAGAGVGVAIS